MLVPGESATLSTEIRITQSTGRSLSSFAPRVETAPVALEESTTRTPAMPHNICDRNRIALRPCR